MATERRIEMTAELSRSKKQAMDVCISSRRGKVARRRKITIPLSSTDEDLKQLSEEWKKSFGLIDQQAMQISDELIAKRNVAAYMQK